MTRDDCAAEGIDAADREIRLAEERLLLATQVEMQRLLNERGMKYKDLSRRLGVSEARVSQIFGDDGGNVTVKTIARIFHQLREKPVIISKSQFDRRIAEARGAADPSPIWTFAGSLDDVDVGPCTHLVAKISHPREPSNPATGLDWVKAETDREARRADAA